MKNIIFSWTSRIWPQFVSFREMGSKSEGYILYFEQLIVNAFDALFSFFSSAAEWPKND